GSTIFYYGDFNFETDAAITAIVSPNNDETYYRNNPICGDAEIKIKNEGKQVITSIEFEYGILNSQTPLQTFTWSGNLDPLSEQSVWLPSLAGFGIPGQHEFIVNIKQVNGLTDD